jgi:hypothetical protein
MLRRYYAGSPGVGVDVARPLSTGQ